MEAISQPLNILYLIPFWIFFGLLAAFLAKRQGKNPFLWFAVGLVFGLFGILFLLILIFYERKKKQLEISNIPPPEPTPVYLSEQWNKNWFILTQGREQQGPIDCDTFLEMWKQGAVGEETWVWSEGMPDWKKIKDLPEFLHELNLLKK